MHSEGTVCTKRKEGENVRLSLYGRGNEEQEELCPPTVKEIADAQRRSAQLSEYFKRGGKSSKKYEISLIENTEGLIKRGK